MENENMRSLNYAMMSTVSMSDFDLDERSFISKRMYIKLNKMIYDRMHNTLRIDTDMDLQLALNIHQHAEHSK